MKSGPLGAITTSMTIGSMYLSLLLPTVATQALSSGASAESLGGQVHIHTALTKHPDHMKSIDLTSALQSAPLRPQVVFKAALNMVQSLETAPTCNRLAALELINGCKDVEGDASEAASRNLDHLLDEVKSEYAARLAVCELLGAKASIPRLCNNLVPSSYACVKSRYRSFFFREEVPADRMCYPEISHAQFGRCLKSLEDKPQSWISYSNARQNAVLMCQASREAIEKEQSLSHFKNLTSVAALLTSVLASTENQSRAWLQEQHDLQEEIRRLQEQNIQEFQKEMRQTTAVVLHGRQTTISTFEDFKTAFDEFSAKVAKTAESVSREMDDTVKSNVENALAQFHEFQSKLRIDVMDGSIQHMDVHQAQLDTSMEIAKGNLQSLYELAVHDVHSLDVDINGAHQNFQASMEAATRHAELMAAGITTIIETVGTKVDGVSDKVDGLGDQVDWVATRINSSFQDVETSFNETVLRLQDSLKTFYDIARFARAITTPRYALAVSGLCGTVVGIYPFSPRLAKLIIGTTSFAGFIHLVFEPTYNFIQNHLFTMIRISWCVAAVVLVVALSYPVVYAHYFRPIVHHHKTIVLPRVEVSTTYNILCNRRFDRAATAPL